MNNRQKVSAFLYPAIMFVTRLFNKNSGVSRNTEYVGPKVPFYTLKAQQPNGQVFDFNTLKGKKTVLVNVASSCGYTAQYDALQSLYAQNSDKVNVLGFPSNDFKGQEPGNDAEIQEFCKINFGVTFPMMQKGAVAQGAAQEVFRWLSDKQLNGWNDKAPTWNFCKYIVDEKGVLTHFFESSISPDSAEVLKALKI